jgi:molybdate transport system substrate-binding protein
MAADFHVLCAGAVKGLVLALQEGFERDSGVRLDARFGTVGAMRDELRAGAPCDVFVATEAMVAALAATASCARGRRGDRQRQDRGRGPARSAGAAIDSADALRAALLGAEALYFPDATRSTREHTSPRCSIGSASARRSRPPAQHANGATAMPRRRRRINALSVARRRPRSATRRASC